MPRRSPPTSLRLATGPPLGRGKPKHTLPSIPRPTFFPVKLSQALVTSPTSLPPLILPPWERHVLQYSTSMPQSSSSGTGGSYNAVAEGYQFTALDRSNIKMGPWDHSRSLSFDVESVLALPKPVAISPSS